MIRTGSISVGNVYLTNDSKGVTGGLMRSLDAYYDKGPNIPKSKTKICHAMGNNAVNRLLSGKGV